jgi:hypothetical protein
MTREEANYKLTAPGATGACGLRTSGTPTPKHIRLMFIRNLRCLQLG